MSPQPWALLAVALFALPARHANDRRPQASGSISTTLVVAAAVTTGLACLLLLGVGPGLATAALLVPALLFIARRAARHDRATRVDARDPAVPLVLDLAAAALRAGRPPADALAAAAPAAPGAVEAAFGQVAGLLRLGARPARAWSVMGPDTPLAPVAAVAVRSASSGARLAMSFERLAVELRADTATSAATRAQRAGVIAMAPLGACFLPSFVLLGVVPVVVGIARSVFGGVP